MAKNNKEAINVEVKSNMPEHSPEIRKVVGDMLKAIEKVERGFSVKNIEPMKDQIRDFLDKNKDSNFLSRSDVNFLFRINRVIYAKVDPPTWRRNLQEQENNNNTNSDQLHFKSVNDKMDRLKKLLLGYGNKSIITTIEDIKENKFYCLKETEMDNEMKLECSMKFEVENGSATVNVMTPEEAYAIKKSYFEIKDRPEEIKNVSYYERVIDNNPNYADNYFEDIAKAREKDAEQINSIEIEQENCE